jgi:hypothetical protein
MAEAAQSACEQCNGMGAQMLDIAQAMGSGQGQAGQAGEGMQGLAGMLSNMEMMQSELDGLSASMQSAQMQMASLSQCMGGMPGGGNPNRISPWQAGDSKNLGWGSGGPGRSQGGGGPEDNNADATQEKVRETTNLKSGQIVGERLVYDSQIIGESRAAFGEAASAASSAAAQEISSGAVPQEYQDAVKAYFGRLEKIAKVESGVEEPAEGGN